MAFQPVPVYGQNGQQQPQQQFAPVQPQPFGVGAMQGGGGFQQPPPGQFQPPPAQAGYQAPGAGQFQGAGGPMYQQQQPPPVQYQPPSMQMQQQGGPAAAAQPRIQQPFQPPPPFAGAAGGAPPAGAGYAPPPSGGAPGGGGPPQFSVGASGPPPMGGGGGGGGGGSFATGPASTFQPGPAGGQTAAPPAANVPFQPPQQQYQQQQQQYQQQQQQHFAPPPQAAGGVAAGGGGGGGVAAPVASPQQIDPRQIPSPIGGGSGNADGDEGDEALVPVVPVYRTASMQPPPRASSTYCAVDDGNCPPTHMRVSMFNFPATGELAAQAGLPAALLVQPFAPVSPGQPEVPLVDAGPEGPPRCRRCRAYLNCHCQFVAGGNQFVCPLCRVPTDLPQAYRAPLGPDGRRADHDARPELCRGVVDFVATQEYMLRTPQAPSCLFVIDVGARSMATGMVEVLAGAIRRAIRSLPAEARVGLITFDDRLHFYNLRASAPQPSILVVPDLTSPFVPLPHDVMLLPVSVCEQQLDTLLDALPGLFSARQPPQQQQHQHQLHPQQQPQAPPERSLAVGAAIAAGCEALKEVGGKMLVFATGLPTAAPGALSARESGALYGTDGEASLLRPQKDRGFYGSLGNRCAGAAVRVDLVLLASDYVDVATLALLPRRTGGQLYYYSSFVRERDEARLDAELARNLAGPFAFEALARVRCSEGFSVAAHHGHFRALNKTDLEVAGVDSNYTLACSLTHDDAVDERGRAFAQCALLYTSADGQRRIRVLTLAFNVTTSVANVFRGADLDVVVNMHVRRAAEALVGGTATLKAARAGVVSACVKALAAYRKHCAPTTASGQLILPESLKLLPIYTLAATRSALLRRGTTVTADERAFQLTAYAGLPVAAAPMLLYPQLYALHEMDECCGMTRADAVDWLVQQGRLPADYSAATGVGDPDRDSRAYDVVLPPQCPLGSEQLSPNGVFLLTTGVHIYLWFGMQVDPDTLYALLGVPSLRDCDTTALGELPVLDNPVSQRYRAVVDGLRHKFPCFSPNITVVKQAEKSETLFFSHFVEDKSSDGSSYVEFLVLLHQQIQKQNQ